MSFLILRRFAASSSRSRRQLPGDVLTGLIQGAADRILAGIAVDRDRDAYIDYRPTPTPDGWHGIDIDAFTGGNRDGRDHVVVGARRTRYIDIAAARHAL